MTVQGEEKQKKIQEKQVTQPKQHVDDQVGDQDPGAWVGTP